jgi:PAS domain S-box-containing protein
MIQGHQTPTGRRGKSMTADYSPPTPRVHLAPAAPGSGIHNLLTLGSDWYWEQDPDFRFTVMVAPEHVRGRDLAQLLGHRRWDRPQAHALTMGWERHQELLARRKPFHDFQYSVSLAGADAPLYVSTSGEPMFDADGAFLGYRGTARDVTAQWEQKGKLQEAETLLGMAATLGRFGAWSIDLATGTTHWTEGMRAIHQVPLSHQSGTMEVLDMYAPEYREALLQAYRRCATEGVPYDLEVEALTAHQERFWARVIGVAVRDHAGGIVRIQGAYQDIHRSKTAAEEHRQLAHRLRTTLDSLTDGFVSVDPQWRITYLNPASLAMLELTGEQAIGQSLWDVLPGLRGSPFEESYRLCMATRTVRRVEAYYEPLQMWARASAFPSEQGIAISFTDITAAMEARQQLERVNAQLETRVRERTAELKRINDELASFTLAVAHDLRAPLAGVSGFSMALAERLAREPDEKVARYISRIQAGVSLMDHLIEGLLELSRIGRTEMQPRRVDLTAVAQDCVQALRLTAGGRMGAVEVQQGLYAHGDARLLRTVIENLLGNAWKFSAQRNPARISFGQESDGTFFVRDNGAGFDMDRVEALFAPFTRLHADEQYRGLGIGLASARRVIERHGGRIWAESSADRGTTFWFTLADPSKDRPE